MATAKAKKSIDDLKMLRNEVHLLVSTMAGHVRFFIFSRLNYFA